MSGLLLAQAMVLLPRLDPSFTSWVAAENSPSAATSSIIALNTGALDATRSGGANVLLNGWVPFTSGVSSFANLFEAMLTVTSGGAGWSNSGVWRDLSGSPSWTGISFVDSVSQVRLDIRLKNSTTVLATATYGIDFQIT